MGKSLANIITGFRIFCSILMMFFPAFSPRFYFLYLFCGLSDIADGIIARKTGGTSDFGARFDTAADIIFIALAMAKLLPSILIPAWLWIWIALILLIKTNNIIYCFIRQKKLLSLHTHLNKITGLLLFLLPLVLPFISSLFSFAAVCAIATLSAIHESRCVASGQMTI